MSESVSFVCPLPPRALRRNRETRSHNWKAALIREYQEAVWCAANALPHGDPDGAGGFKLVPACPMCADDWPWDRAHLRLTWRHHRAGPDVDNALASCKWLIDVLKATGPRPLGIIVDDSPAHLTVELRTEKVRSKDQEGVLVEVTRLDVIEEALG